MAHSSTVMSSHGLGAAMDLPWLNPHLITAMATGRQKLQPQLIVPSVVTQNIAGRKQKAKVHYDKRVSKQLGEFTIGERIFVKASLRNRSKPWLHGEVVNKPAPK